MPLPFRAALVAAALAITAPAAAEETAPLPEMAEVERAWSAGDYPFVRRALERLATEAPTPLAQYRFGRVLAEGRGGPRDLAAAARWLEQAAGARLPEAATLLARLLLSGAPGGPERDAPRAAALLSEAATMGHAEAQYLLGLLLRAGDGIAADPAQSLNWIRAAAEQGHLQAQYAAAQAYAAASTAPEGAEGTARAQAAENAAEGLRWLRAAAAGGHVQAQVFLGHALDSGRGAPQDRSAALDWYRRAAEAGHPLAQRLLGTRYLRGDGVDANAAEALRWLQAAAQQGEAGAESNLGYMYATGTGVPRDPAAAATWYARAADQGLPRAMTALADLLERGEGLPADLPGAVDLYRRAAEAGHSPARLRLGALVASGATESLIAPHHAVPFVADAARAGDETAAHWLETRAEDGLRPAQTALGALLLENPARAEEAGGWLTRAARAGDPVAQAALGTAYSTGTGLPLDYVQAHAWLNIAATSGHAEAARTRALIGALMTPDQIAAAQDIARAHFADQSAPAAPGQTVRTDP